MDVVLLSNSKDRIEAIRAGLKRKSLACTVVPNEESVWSAMRNCPEGILVIDAAATGQLIRVLQNRKKGWPILVLTRTFDSNAWVEIFKAGASEVIGEPLSATKIDSALEGLIPLPQHSGGIQTIWSMIASRLGIGKGRQRDA